MLVELREAINQVTQLLEELNFDLKTLIDSSPMQKIAAIRNGVNAVCLNEETRTKFEMAARIVFRKYKALYPERLVMRYTRKYNAIDAIYNALNQKTKSADISEVMGRLQMVVDENVIVKRVEEPSHYEIDLSNLDFDKLRKAFQKVPRKNELVYDLNEAVEKKLEKMLQENPLRMEFYERYKEIVEEYNKGKNEVELQRSFEKLTAFIQDLSHEEKRAYLENLDEQTLSIFDLLVQNKDLTNDEREKVKKVAKETLDVLIKEKLNVPNWKESRELKASIKSTIYNHLLYLPEEKYNDEEVSLKSLAVYQHVYSYSGFRY